MRAIDIHGHVGDILYESGGGLIFKTGIDFPRSSGEQLLDEQYLFRKTRRAKILEKYFPMLSRNNERRRNAAATLENLQLSLNTEELTGVTIEKCVCLPVAPHNTYEDMRAAAKADSRIIAFTSPDFSGTMDDCVKKLESDLKDGAAGVKIHPIIQEVESDSSQMMQAVETIAAFNVPILLHSGRASYYPVSENKQQFTENASIIKIERLIKAFPNARFIVGHAGLGELRAAIDLLHGYKNAYVDTSFQPPEAITALISAFGSDKVLFGSDWPYGLRTPAILAVKEACKNDNSLLSALLYDNAVKIL